MTTNISIPMPDYEELFLPTRGLLGHNIEKLYIRPMTMKEEKMLTNKTLAKTGSVHDEIFKSCLGHGISSTGEKIEKTQINIDDLYVEDEYAMFIFLRAISYGLDYDAEIVCPVCKAKRIITVNLETDLNINYADENTPKNIEVTLPKAKRKVWMDYPRKKHSKNLDNPLDILPRVITKIDGEDQFTADLWLQNLIGMDVAVLRKAIQDVPFGMDKEIQYICSNSQCASEGEPQKVDLPITPEFFRL